MSLVLSYVRVPTGEWLKNPVFGGEVWFLCFDDKYPEVELVVAERMLNQIKNVDKVASAILRRTLFEGYSNLTHLGRASRIFSTDTEVKLSGPSDFLPAHSFGVRTGKYTTMKSEAMSCLLRHDGRSEERPNNQGVYFDFSGR